MGAEGLWEIPVASVQYCHLKLKSIKKKDNLP